MQPIQVGAYRVIITNSVGAITSEVATLTIAITEPPNFDPMVPPPTPGGPLEFGFMGQAGQSYSVLWREQLSVGTWEVLTNIPTLSATQPVLIQDEIAGRAQRFYRIVTPMQP